MHFAWKLPENTDKSLKPRLRRITYELAPIEPATGTSADHHSRALRTPPTAQRPDGAHLPALGQGASIDTTSTITRQHAWNDAPPT
ncbi:hypothetical protein ACFOOM_18960 [Streptomyces echinoruber]|uniref:Uncharacterized protein n=1 Tax=Streptomyces echinoruber TaxID=68898 RepID=A0A918R7K7_9ACTN|nr:hypothetical protein [Streptomyces echinoruber]GGZ88639.1 hypothetical protein GCM10010389_28740 [Streptomyces echinoruber]